MPSRRFSARRALALALALGTCLGPIPAHAPAVAQGIAGHPDWPGRGQLFVGTCYQPIDRTPAQIREDIQVMKRAGFTMVRMGDLSWDSFEPQEGQFTFAWFDDVLAQMHAAGIRVIVDIPGLPAPLWLHKHYPGADIVTQQGVRLHPATRYQVNITDPDYRRLIRRLAVAMMQRYAHNPAVIAFGYDNEVGSSPMSYSAGDRERFVAWLQRRYGSIAALNAAWATQRWSRRINDWSEVDLPYGEGPGPNERNIDLRRYWSDATIAALVDLDDVRKRYAPNLPAASNLWPNAPAKGFDWSRAWDRISTYGAEGFYPSDPLGAAFEVMMIKAGHETPVWFNEFTAGGGGDYGQPGRSRMWAYFGLLYYAQSFLAWTFNSHLGGEEQSLFGLIDHDNRPSWKVGEFARFAGEFKTLQRMGFPRYAPPQVAIAYSSQSDWLTSPPPGPNTMKQYFKANYADQVKAAFAPFFADNIDAAVIDIGHDPISAYKLVVVPADYMMDQASAEAIRRYVAAGGTVVMTGYSAKADESGKWFDTPLPGRLSDVFGLRTSQFYRAETPLAFTLNGTALTGTDPYYEVLELDTATPLARFDNTPDHSAAITVNRYGKGRAIYLATAAQADLIGPLVRSLYGPLGIAAGPVTPPGVVARTVEGRTLYVNTQNKAATVSLSHPSKDALTSKQIAGELRLNPFDTALLETDAL
ncbi:beta-galactosidase [Sphingomonas morindae]|uniref:beta-galactosidase n=1 Tax=Sphingomonas morindae TaxID=1541170 RepID=A0ABY4XDM0_9SPHN|nr:beta-galactosidase [Sphingomonas morindae]USI74861.1 beta-galactosidase [Sphingomonas morindae]